MTRLFCLVGPTAVGKTEIAAAVLEPLAGAMISADARQVYRFLDIGTSKPTPALQARVPVRMLDLVTPEQAYSAADFARDARGAIAELAAQHRPFMLVGGSGLYLKALFRPFFEVGVDCTRARSTLSALRTADLYETLRDVDPDCARRLHSHDRQRILRALEVFEATGTPLSRHYAGQDCRSEFLPVYVGLELPRPVLCERITRRFARMLEDGLVGEVRHLLRMGYDARTPPLNAIGYQEIVEHLNGGLTLAEAAGLAEKRTRRYARRQMTWFRHQPGIEWLNAEDRDQVIARVRARFDSFLAETG